MQSCVPWTSRTHVTTHEGVYLPRLTHNVRGYLNSLPCKSNGKCIEGFQMFVKVSWRGRSVFYEHNIYIIDVFFSKITYSNLTLTVIQCILIVSITIRWYNGSHILKRNKFALRIEFKCFCYTIHNWGKCINTKQTIQLSI